MELDLRSPGPSLEPGLLSSILLPLAERELVLPKCFSSQLSVWLSGRLQQRSVIKLSTVRCTGVQNLVSLHGTVQVYRTVYLSPAGLVVSQEEVPLVPASAWSAGSEQQLVFIHPVIGQLVLYWHLIGQLAL